MTWMEVKKLAKKKDVLPLMTFAFLVAVFDFDVDLSA